MGTSNLLLILTMLLLIPCPRFPRALSLSFNFPTLLPTSVRQSLILKGDFSVSGDDVELAISENNLSNPMNFKAGRLYHGDLLFLWDSSSRQAASFNCSFQFRIARDSASAYPGDGLAFFLLDPMPSLDLAHNSQGHLLGLFNDTTNASVVAVEFDTFKDALDPNDNHVGIDVNGISSVLTAPVPFNLTTATAVFTWVDYSSIHTLLEVYATDLSSAKPSSPLLSHSINLSQLLPQYVQIGFSASTGPFSEYHHLVSWSFNSWMSPVPLPPVLPPVGSTIGQTASAPQSSVASPHSPEKDSKLGVGLIAGVITGIVCVAVLPLGLCWCCRQRRKRWQQVCQPSLPLLQPVQPSSVTWADDQRMDSSSEIDMTGVPSLAHVPGKLNYRLLSEATGNFAEASLLGKGGFGHVYKGVLPDGSEVAVKRGILERSAQGEKEFLAEVNIISRIRHNNFVQLKGWCQDGANLLLVYEYLPNGSLDRHLFNGSNTRTVLDWSKRYHIVRGLGCALEYLHKDCAHRAILHRDIKSSNVLLDAHFNAKLGDFGLARQLKDGVEGHTAIMTRCTGTPGYTAPEIYEMGHSTLESDIYSYGVVLLEVACGRQPFAVETSDLPAQFKGKLLDWVWDLHSKGRLMEAANKRLEGEFDEAEMVRTLTVGLACCHPHAKMRPTSVGVALHALVRTSPLLQILACKPVARYYSMADFDDINILAEESPIPA